MIPAVPSPPRLGPWRGSGKRTQQRGEGEGDGGQVPSSVSPASPCQSASGVASVPRLPGQGKGCDGAWAPLLAPHSRCLCCRERGVLAPLPGPARAKPKALRIRSSSAPPGGRAERVAREVGLGRECRQRLRGPRVGLGSSAGFWRR